MRNRRDQPRAVAAFIALALSVASELSFAADEPVRISVNAITAGALSQTDLGLGMLEARAALSPNLLVTAAPSVLLVEGGAEEYQFRTAAILRLPLGPIQLDDRNLWVFSDAGTTRYRNRLRLTAPVSVGQHVLRFQIFDEIHHQQGGRGWFRNVIAGGVGIDINGSMSTDAYWMVLDEDDRRQSSMFLLLLTVRIR